MTEYINEEDENLSYNEKINAFVEMVKDQDNLNTFEKDLLIKTFKNLPEEDFEDLYDEVEYEIEDFIELTGSLFEYHEECILPIALELIKSNQYTEEDLSFTLFNDGDDVSGMVQHSIELVKVFLETNSVCSPVEDSVLMKELSRFNDSANDYIKYTHKIINYVDHTELLGDLFYVYHRDLKPADFELQNNFEDLINTLIDEEYCTAKELKKYQKIHINADYLKPILEKRTLKNNLEHF